MTSYAPNACSVAGTKVMFSDRSGKVHFMTPTFAFLCCGKCLQADMRAFVVKFWIISFNATLPPRSEQVIMAACGCSVSPCSGMFSGSFYAVLAGFLGAAASLSAKLSLGESYLREMCETRLSGWTETPAGSSACDWVTLTL